MERARDCKKGSGDESRQELPEGRRSCEQKASARASLGESVSYNRRGLCVNASATAVPVVEPSSPAGIFHLWTSPARPAVPAHVRGAVAVMCAVLGNPGDQTLIECALPL